MKLPSINIKTNFAGRNIVVLREKTQMSKPSFTLIDIQARKCKIDASVVFTLSDLEFCIFTRPK